MISSLRSVLLAGLLAMTSFVGPALAAEHSEAAIKAAYLYRFAGYVEWTDPAPRESPFVIAVVNAPALAAELRRLLPGHAILGRTAEVHEFGTVRDARNAEIIYVGPGQSDLLRTWLNRTPEGRSLIVTDEEGGLGAGSALNFLTIDHTVRFEVSLPAARRSGLRISSELLGVAIRVQSLLLSKDDRRFG